MQRDRWYAIRTKPGAQRMDRALPKTEGELKARIARLRKREVPVGETIIERDCRDAGYEIFMPSYMVEVKHHRTKLWLEKRFPLLVGYAFVNLPAQDFETFRRKVDSALCVLKPGGQGHRPFEFSEWAVNQLRIVEREALLQFDLQKVQRIRAEEVAAKQLSRRQLKELFPKGRAVRVSLGSPIGAGLLGTVIGPSSQGTVKTILSTLTNSLTFDIPVELLEEVA